MPIPDDWDFEFRYSLDIIATLTCRLLAHPACSFFELRELVQYYKEAVSARLVAGPGLLHPGVIDAFADSELWPGDVLVELGIVDEMLGGFLNIYQVEY